MPDQPENRMEASLRAAANARRQAAGGPFVLHPVDRQRLQREAAARTRHQPSRAEGGWSGWLARNWLRLGLATSACAILVLCVQVFFFSPGPRPTDEPAANPTPPAAGGNAAAKTVLPEPAGSFVTTPKAVAVAPPPSPTPAPRAAAPAEARSLPKPTLPVATATPEASPTTALSEQAAGASPAINPTQRDNLERSVAGRPAAADKAASSPAPVLSRFRLQQQGNRLSVVDADGSIYSGQAAPPLESAAASQAASFAVAKDEIAPAPALEPAAPADRGAAQTLSRRYGARPPAGSAAAPARAPAPTGLAQKATLAAAEAPPTSGSFKVAGTNRTLQQPVELSFILAPSATNALAPVLDWLGGPTPPLGTNRTLRGTNSPAPLRGTLRVGNQTPVPFEARPANR